MLAGSQTPSITAVVNMDGSSFLQQPAIAQKPFPIPCLMLLGEKSHQWHGERGSIDRAALEKFYLSNQDTVHLTTLKNCGHGIFSDLPILLKSTWATKLLANFINFDLDASSQNAYQSLIQAARFITSFFNKHLKKKYQEKEM